jgi:hypothetical protein
MDVALCQLDLRIQVLLLTQQRRFLCLQREAPSLGTLALHLSL